MPLSLLTKLLISIVAVGFTPGPANIYALSCGMKHGRRHAMGMWIGLVAGFSVALGIVGIISYAAGTAMGHYVEYIKYPGAAYIAWLGWGMMHSYKDNDSTSERPCTFLDGFLVQLTNAKMILFALTTFGTFVLPNPNHTLADFGVVAAFLYIAGPVANLTWLMTGLWLRPYFDSYKRTPSIIMGLALIACAVLILMG